MATGRFIVPVVIQPNFEGGITSASVGDFNGDGRDDLVLAEGGNSPTLIKTYWQSGGELVYVGATSTYDLPEHSAVGDLDGDGGDDLALVHVGWSAIGLYMSTSPASLPPEQLYTLSVSWGSDVRISDVTGDGCKDLVASRGYQVAVFRGHGCEPTSDLRLTGTLSGQGINISADNLGADGALADVVVDMAVSSRSGLLSVSPIPAECHYVEVSARTSKLRCELDAIDASSGTSWFIPLTVAEATARNRISFSAIAHTTTQERRLDNNQVWQAWSNGAGMGLHQTSARSPRPAAASAPKTGR